MKRLFPALALLLALLLPAAPAFSKTLYRWKVGTLAPKGIGWAKQVEDVIVPAVDEASNGEVKLKVFWGGVMGDDEDYLRKMKIGQLQAAGLSGQGATLACPEFAVVELPFLFRNYDEVDYIRVRMTPTFDYYFSQYGLKLAFWMDQDFDQIYSSKAPTADLEDFRQARFVTWYGPIEEAVLKALGAEVIPLDVPQIASAWRSGEVDAGISPAIWMVGAQLYTTVKYVNLIKIRYAPVVIVVTLDAWEGIPKEYRDRIWAVRQDVTNRFCAGSRTDNQKSLDAMIAYGIEEVRMTDKAYRAVQDRARTVYGELANEVYPVGLLEEITRHLSAFRAESPGDAGASTAWKPPVAPPAPKPAPAPKTVVKPEPAKPALTPKPPTPAAKPKPAPKTTPKRSAWERRVQQIRDVQTRLKDMGYYPGAIDGIYGPMTYRGITRFQKERGMTQTGAIDPDLLKAMGVE